MSGYAPQGYYDPVTGPDGEVTDYDDPRPNGHIVVTVETAPPNPYGYGDLPLHAAVTGPAKLADLFDAALRRSARRRAQRERALLRSRPRYRSVAPPLTADDPTPRGWHRRGECPECSHAQA